MKKLTLAFTAAAMVLSTLSAHAGTSVDQDTVNSAIQYGECFRLAQKQKLTGSEKTTDGYCFLTVKSVELNIEKKALLKRIQAIDAELSSLSQQGDDAP